VLILWKGKQPRGKAGINVLRNYRAKKFAFQAIIAVAITRAHKLLVKAMAEGAAVHDLSRFFSPEVARQITTAEQEVTAGKGQVRDAAILMVDIRGFTRLSSMIKPDERLLLDVLTKK
jgi:class 3 adenylate cyclase